MQKNKKKEFNAAINYLDLRYCEVNESIIINTTKRADNTEIMLIIDINDFLHCVTKSQINQFKKQLINNIKSL